MIDRIWCHDWLQLSTPVEDPDEESESQPEEVDAVEEDPEEEDETGATGLVTLDEEEEESD